MQDININCENTDTGFNCLVPQSDPFITPFFSSGEFLISILLLIIILLFLISFLKKGIGSVSVIRRYQGNNSPDGKEFYEI